LRVIQLRRREKMTNKSYPCDWYDALSDCLFARKYSLATRKRYILICLDLQISYPDRELSTLTRAELEAYIAGIARNSAASTVNQTISALTFLWRNVYGMKFPIPVRPVKDKSLPIVISLRQVIQLIAAARNLRTRLALALAYSAGLRISEIAQLQIDDIDRERKVIHIHSGKGRKDRVVPLSDLVAAMLDKYLEKAKPSRWLFRNTNGGPAHVRSLQYAFADARSRAGIPDTVTMHTLRHSFATHLVERGEDLFTIKELMGHSSLSTLQQYIHLANNGILATRSPLDDPAMF
jgi:integrase/recombinase XerD